MSEKHKWADVIIAMANGETGQWLCAGCRWEDGVSYNPLSHPHLQWRIKPRTIMIGDMEVPEPEKNPLTHGTGYFVPAMGTDTGVSHFLWSNYASDTRMLERGVVHLEMESAVTHAKALIKISGGKV